MTRYTTTKINRRRYEFIGVDKDRKPIWGKCIGYDKATDRIEKVIDLSRGAKMKVLVSPGQMINNRKEFNRQVKKGTIIYPPGIRI